MLRTERSFDMAVRPNELLKEVKGAIRAQIAALEKSIDRQMREYFDGNSVSINLLALTEGKLAPAVRDGIKRLYEEAGWVVHFDEGDSQKDGPWCQMILSPKKQTIR